MLIENAKPGEFVGEIQLEPFYEFLDEETYETDAGTVSCLHSSGRSMDTTLAIEILNLELGLGLDLLNVDGPPMDCPVFSEFAMMILSSETSRPRRRGATKMPPFDKSPEDEALLSQLPTVLDPLSWTDEEPPARRWVVDQWIPWNHVTGLYGPPGNGKTLLAQMLLTACALGKPWLGMHTAQLKVFGLFCEDEAEELQRRQFAINRHFDCLNGDLENMLMTSLHGKPSMLMDFLNGDLAATDLYDWLLGEVLGFGAQLVVVDTAAATFGGDENNRAQVTRYLNEILARIAHEIDGAVVLCAHPSKSSDYSGSTAWDASFRSRLNLMRYEEKDDDDEPSEQLSRLRILEKQKANYSGVGDKIVLEWYDGYFRVQGCDSDAVTRIEKQVRERQAEEAFLTALDALTEQGRNVSHSRQGANYAPKLIKQQASSSGFTKRDLASAMERLLQSGRIMADQPVSKGPDRKTRYGLKRMGDSQ